MAWSLAPRNTKIGTQVTGSTTTLTTTLTGITATVAGDMGLVFVCFEVLGTATRTWTVPAGWSQVGTDVFVVSNTEGIACFINPNMSAGVTSIAIKLTCASDVIALNAGYACWAGGSATHVGAEGFNSAQSTTASTAFAACAPGAPTQPQDLFVWFGSTMSSPIVNNGPTAPNFVTQLNNSAVGQRFLVATYIGERATVAPSPVNGASSALTSTHVQMVFGVTAVPAGSVMPFFDQ